MMDDENYFGLTEYKMHSDVGRYREAVGPISTAKLSRDMKSRDMTSCNMKFSFS